MAPFSILDVIPDTISLTRPANDTNHYMDGSDVKPNIIVAMPSPTKVSTLLAAHPISETGPGQSSNRYEPTEPAIPPRVRVPASKLLEMKAARLA